VVTTRQGGIPPPRAAAADTTELVDGTATDKTPVNPPPHVRMGRPAFPRDIR
jgi:hypothetical protein